MRRQVCGFAAAASLLLALAIGAPALAQKSGGVLKISFFDNPASMSLHEEATGAALRPKARLFWPSSTRMASSWPATAAPRRATW